MMEQSHLISRQIFEPKKTPMGSEILRYARQLRGLTQAESAAHYGIEERTLRRWENREYSPKWNDVIGLVEDVYALNILELIGKIHANNFDNN
nr:helix-turn-helix transcriptional regulator [Pseudoalteromonas xiamenensis]